MNGTAARGTPLMAGWAMAAAAGLVAAAVSMVAIGLDFNQGAFVGIVICGIVGLILGFSWAEASTVPAARPHAGATVAPATVAPADMTAAPVEGIARRPQALSAAREGGADDLKLIKGVGPKLEELCHSLGFYHFDQIASWTAEEIAWVDENLEGFKGRVSRDEWVKQARILASGGATEFSSRTQRDGA